MRTDADATTVDASTDETSTTADSIEKIERTDVGVSVSCKLKRGSGTRDQDELRAKVKAETIADAKADLEDLKPYLRGFAQELREIQPSVAADDEAEQE